MTTFSKLIKTYEKKCLACDVPVETVMAYMVELCQQEKYQLYMNINQPVPLQIQTAFEQGMERILKQEPLAHVLGYSWFYGYRFIVNPDVLIPRVETEELCAHILSRIDTFFEGSDKLTCVDVGTGSGAIAIAVSKEEEKIQMYATDISEEAVQTAKENAKNNQTNITFMTGDMLQPLIEKQLKFDVLISNPPYIPQEEQMEKSVVDFEPHVALFGGSDGLKFYREIFQHCGQVLKSRAMMAFEMGYDQKQRMSELVETLLPECRYEILKDMNGKDRMLFVYFEPNESGLQ